MKFQAVLFDLDDTLHDKSATLRAMAAKQYVQNDLAAWGMAQDDWESQYVELNRLRIEKTEVFARLRDRYRLPLDLATSLRMEFDEGFGELSVACPGAVQLVQSCKAFGLKTGLVTNGRDAFQRSKLSGMGLAEHFDAIVTSGGLGIKKPDLRIFHACLAMLGVVPTQVVFIGDDFEADMEPALALGMHAVWKSTEVSARVAFASDSCHEIQAHLWSA